jgi:hypothetical protein
MGISQGRVLGMLVLAAILGLSACQDSPPSIGKDLPHGTWRDASVAFDARVKSRFPVGSSEGDMLAELRRERFTITANKAPQSGYSFSALRDAAGFPCKLFWSVNWNADDGRISGIEAQYNGSCV